MLDIVLFRPFYFYPRPPRGGRQIPPLYLHIPRVISIHALREEGDMSNMEAEAIRMIFLSTPSARRATFRRASIPSGVTISIHALREEGDLIPTRWSWEPPQFLSTPSARRATTGRQKLLRP